MPAMKKPSSTQRAIRVFVALLACIALASICGCRATDVFKEIVYDQSAEQVDADNEQRVIISDSTSSTLSDQVSSVEHSDTQSATEEVQNLVIYASNPNTMDFPTKESIFSLIPSFAGFEASRGVSYYLSNEENALRYEIEDEELEEDDSEVEMVVEVGDAGDDGEEGEGSNGDEGDENSIDGELEGQEAEEGGTDAEEDSITKVNNTKGKYSKTENYSHIAAYGSLAVIVQAIGGEGALVATDAETLAGGFSTVFADEGAANIAVGWTDDGDSIKNIDVDAIIASGAETILCYDTAYYDDLSKKDIKKLNDAGIGFSTVYQLTYTTGLKNTVTTIGEMLSEATADEIAEAGNTVENAAAYVTFHDELLDVLLKANNNKLASADDTTYEESNSTSYSYNSSAAYTLLIDGYDSSAKYTGSSGTFSPTSDGALLATLGYKSRTTSYYMQVGGVINNAATRFRASADGKMMVVWQFSYSHLAFSKNLWSYKSNSLLATAFYPSSGKLWEFTLLTTDESSTNESTYSQVGGLPGASFGTTTFPTLITTTQAAKDALIKNSQRSKGLYTPYDISPDDGFSFFGVNDGSTTLFTCIGVDGASATENVFADTDGIPEDYIYVNPCGLVSSWVAGDSMEALLEAAWINDVINTDSDEIGYWDYVKEFYSTFYRYNLSSADKADILDGE